MARIKLSLKSTDFENGQIIPPQYTADGSDHPPDLRWTHAPEGTRSFALIMEGLDPPRGPFTHWVRYDIPAHDGTRRGVDGRNDFQMIGYRGPDPAPRHGLHRYLFHLYALDVDTLDLPPGATREEVERAMQGHVLDQATLMGTYERK